MKKIFMAILAVVLVVIVGGAVFVFAFDKKVPTEWFSSQVEEVKNSKLVEDEKLPKKAAFFHEVITYTKDGDKTVETYSEKMYLEYKDNSTEDAENYEIKSKNYDSQGKLSEEYTTRYYKEGEVSYREEKGNKQEISDLSEAKMFFMYFLEFYNNEGTALNSVVIDYIDNHLDHISQKGLSITLHMVGDNTKLAITYGLVSKKIEKVELTLDNYTNDVLTSRLHEYAVL